MKAIAKYWRYHGTKMLGTLTIIIPGLMAIDKLIPPDHTRYWLAANVIVGALTFKRGFTNSKAQ